MDKRDEQDLVMYFGEYVFHVLNTEDAFSDGYLRGMRRTLAVFGIEDKFDEAYLLYNERMVG